MRKRALLYLCPLLVALVGGCATNPRFSLDPLNNKATAANDPLKGGNAMARNDGRMPGTARLLAPDTASSGGALTSAPVNEFKPLGTGTMAPTLGALAANTRPRTDATANDGSPFGTAKTAPVKQAQWNAAGSS